MELLYGDVPEDSQRHIQLARHFLTLMRDCDRKRLRKIEIDSIEMRNLFGTDHIEEGFGILKALLRDAENLSDSEETGEDAVVWYLYFCRLFAEKSREYRKECVPEYLEKALVLCEQHPKLAKKKRVQMAKIEVCLEATRHYEKENLDQAMCVLKKNDEKKLSGLLAEIDKLQRTNHDDVDEYMLKTLYPELTGDEWKILERKGPTIVRQEQAQRYLHALKAVSGEKEYFSVDKGRREAYWGKLEKVRHAYEKGNTVVKGQEDVTDTWEDRALALKDLTSDGMTWQIDYNNLNEEMFAMVRNLYDSCITEEEKKEIAEHALELWRNNYQNVNLKGLSVENLNMLSEAEKICGYAPLPSLVEERSVRLNEKELLHDFFRKIPEYSCMEDWRSVDRKRKMEVKDIFDRLLAQNVDEWVSDLRNWLNGTENLWIVRNINFFREEDETAEDPKRHKLYEICQEYLMYFIVNSRKQLAERIRGCGV